MKIPEEMMDKESVLGWLGFSFAFADLIITSSDKILPLHVSLSKTNGILAAMTAKNKEAQTG